MSEATPRPRPAHSVHCASQQTLPEGDERLPCDCRPQPSATRNVAPSAVEIDTGLKLSPGQLRKRLKQRNRACLRAMVDSAAARAIALPEAVEVMLSAFCESEADLDELRAAIAAALEEAHTAFAKQVEHTDFVRAEWMRRESQQRAAREAAERERDEWKAICQKRILERDAQRLANEEVFRVLRRAITDEERQGGGALHAARLVVAKLDAVETRVRELEAAVTAARPEEDWCEEDGAVLWWCFPVEEPPYVGTPLDDDWPAYHTHWTRITVPKHDAARQAGEVDRAS